MKAGVPEPHRIAPHAHAHTMQQTRKDKGMNAPNRSTDQQSKSGAQTNYPPTDSSRHGIVCRSILDETRQTEIAQLHTETRKWKGKVYNTKKNKTN
jgi:hypothetical protein